MIKSGDQGSRERAARRYLGGVAAKGAAVAGAGWALWRLLRRPPQAAGAWPSVGDAAGDPGALSAAKASLLPAASQCHLPASLSGRTAARAHRGCADSAQLPRFCSRMATSARCVSESSAAPPRCSLAGALLRVPRSPGAGCVARQAFETDARAYTGTAPDDWMVPPSGGSGGVAASSSGAPDEPASGLAAGQAAAPLPADAAHESRAAQAHSNGLTAAAREARPAGGPSTAAAAAQQQGTSAPHPAAPARAADTLHVNGAATACAPPTQAAERRAPSTQAPGRPPEADAPSAPDADAPERSGGTAERGRAGGTSVTDGKAQRGAEPVQRAHASLAAVGGLGGGPARPPPQGGTAAQPAQSGEAAEHARSGGSAGAAQQALQPAVRAPGSVAAAQREPTWLARRDVFIAVTAGMRQQVFRFQPGQRSWLAWQVRGRPGLPAAAWHAARSALALFPSAEPLRRRARMVRAVLQAPRQHSCILHRAGRPRRHASFMHFAHVLIWRQGLR